jgi:UDP-2,3-diacylglucosamine hydrolase
MKEAPKQFIRQPELNPAPAAAPAEPTVLFVSDAHFHLAPDQAESARMLRFLEFLEFSCGADHLVLLGDIFDFWFDYPHFRLNGYDALLAGLDQVRAAGTVIHFVGGNHDIWAADYFRQRYACHTFDTASAMQFGSRHVRLDHGDGLLTFDFAYSAFRTMVRARAGILLAKSLHPEILFALSTWLSGHSRGANRDEASRIERRARRWFNRQQSPAWDLIVMGHVHHGFQLEHEGRQMAALAGWFDPLSFGLLQNGHFSLLDFARDPLPTL